MNGLEVLETVASGIAEGEKRAGYKPGAYARRLK